MSADDADEEVQEAAEEEAKAEVEGYVAVTAAPEDDTLKASDIEAELEPGPGREFGLALPTPQE